MSDVLSDELLREVRQVRTAIADWRASRLASAGIVNSKFDVRVKTVAVPGNNNGFGIIVGIEPLRVLLIFAAFFGGIFVVPGTAVGDRQGFPLPDRGFIEFDIHRHPGLVSIDWYFGTRSSVGNKVYVIEILDRRRR